MAVKRGVWQNQVSVQLPSLFPPLKPPWLAPVQFGIG
jgi:hypothetical protein